MSQFLNAIKERRSIYGISKESVISDQRIEEIVGEAVLHTPSSFNSQSARVVVLLGEQHDKLWNITKETLRKIVPAENFGSTEEKLASFQNGRGTVLFFEDQDVIKGLQDQFGLYADNFPIWSLESSGMLQFVIWTALAAEGVGASLQHYNPLIDEQVAAEWNIPSSWKLLAQMPFGKPTGAAGEKQFAPLDSRLKVFK
ncbi:nitroreductase family protein [Paenibacillus segetis]|uniref:Nitroreductase n=1 Tax=Paenibacillus segetis TaxID=1325360 RepID=A0ABQ1YCH2_9BACL|nr:nitroreductase family protein [Paenibacillus segetis]GGH19473.1 nitroreductase [Paenibacillus segetis]